MTEAEWLTCSDPLPMLLSLPDSTDHRHLRLFGVALCRRIGPCSPTNARGKPSRRPNSSRTGRRTKPPAVRYAAAFDAREAARVSPPPGVAKATPLCKYTGASSADFILAAPQSAALVCAAPVGSYWAGDVITEAAVGRAWAESAGDVLTTTLH